MKIGTLIYLNIKGIILAQGKLILLNLFLKNFYDHVISENAYILDLGSEIILKSTILKNNWNYKSLDIDNLNFEKDKFMFENNTFDVIISLAVIEHLDDPSIFLRRFIGY